MKKRESAKQGPEATDAGHRTRQASKQAERSKPGRNIGEIHELPRHEGWDKSADGGVSHLSVPWAARETNDLYPDGTAAWEVVAEFEDFDLIIVGWLDEATARLIAAAPEMLSACKRMASCAGSGSVMFEEARSEALTAIRAVES